MIRTACSDLLGYCPLHVATDLGLWGNLGIELQQVGSAERDWLFAHGEVNLKTLSLHSFVGNSGGGRVIAVLAGVRPGSAVDRLVLGPRCPKVTHLDDARIAYVRGGLEHLYFAYFFRHLGIRWPEEARRTEVESRTRMLDLFRRGEVDAIITYGEHLDALGKATNTIVDALPYEAPIFTTVLAAWHEVIRDAPTELSAFLEGYFRAADLVLNRGCHPDVRRILLRHYPGPWSKLDAVLQGYDFFTIERNKALMLGAEQPSLPDRIRECASIWHDLGITEDMGDPSALIAALPPISAPERCPC